MSDQIPDIVQQDQTAGAVQQDNLDSGIFPFDAFDFNSDRQAENPRILRMRSKWRPGGYLLSPQLISKADTAYTLTDSDLPCLVEATAVTADRTLTLPTLADNLGKRVGVKRTDTTAAYVLIIDGEGAEVIQNGGTSFTTLEIDDAAANCVYWFLATTAGWVKETPLAWYKTINPGTGWFASKTTGWTADSFSGGLTVDFSSVVPAGTRAVRCAVYQAVATGGLYYRKGSDANIANTPVVSNENSTTILLVQNEHNQCVLWLSTSYTIDLAVQNDTQDVYVAYPVEYLL